MDVPDQKCGSLKEVAHLFHCDLFDTEIVHKIGQILLLGLSTACVDNTSGDLFKSPASVAVDIRKEMVDYLTQRSETFIAESLIEQGSPYMITSEHPVDIVSDLIDDFASSKQNLFSRVSGWLLSEKREDKIDDFVQEMEFRSFWLMERRLSIGQTLLKYLDPKNEFHCKMNFGSAEDLSCHTNACSFRPISCTNVGCRASFSSVHMEKHDSLCPFKILPCEQKCSESITRREMDRHCITVCPMRLVNCPFYHVGCQSSIPHTTTEQHCSEFLEPHLLCILRLIHKEAAMDDLKCRVEQLLKVVFPTHVCDLYCGCLSSRERNSKSLRDEGKALIELSSVDQLCEAQCVRSLTRIVKDLDAKIGPLDKYSPGTASEECNNTADVPQHVADKTMSKVQSTSESISTLEDLKEETSLQHHID
ncbi:hypothetical protein IFM89_014688 [Coptis chinensis]|uniref:TRAF-type domain-containing protein n=1 Tax=Coptis chinensis TaxID=261450 RepID=A0A835HEI0_9MAGN|nr:hypothetical protein IFM89_014688 [Coptis chinensis]